MPKPVRQPPGVPHDVAAIRLQLRAFLDTLTPNREKIGNAKYGVYAFYDYDGEPLYVGQTNERLRSRIGRHLTNQRTDAVAMNVLDPFEVAEIEVWPLWELQQRSSADTDAKRQLAAAEYSVFQAVLRGSSFGTVLNEKDIPPVDEVPLPQSYRGRIVPEDLYELRQHPDVRIARRATTIAALARVISERDASKGLRRTLVTQAHRLHALSLRRYNEVQDRVDTVKPGEEV